MSDQRFVIVGAGLAGAKAAQELRERGFDGRITLVGAEPDRPYERPPLTKDFLRGESDRENVYVHDGSFYERHEIELLTATRAAHIDPVAARLTLQDGHRLSYDRLLLTTGAEPRRLPIPGAGLDGVLYLRTLSDSDLLRARLSAGARVVVVGAGWIGSEVAASARQRGLEVTMIDPLTLPNERIFGAEIGTFYRDVHLRHGVRMLLGTGVEAFEGTTALTAVRTSDGRSIDCDFAVVGIGVRPRTELAAAAGAETGNGLIVDQGLRSSLPNVFAAGDVANAWHPTFKRRLRVEHWDNALHQGAAAARSMLGETISYDRIPYFFSDQYDVGMEYSGFAPEWDEVVFRGEHDSGEFIAFWIHAGRVVGGMNVNVWDVNEHVQTLIRSQRVIDPAVLRDPDTPLESLVEMVTTTHP